MTALGAQNLQNLSFKTILSGNYPGAPESGGEVLTFSGLHKTGETDVCQTTVGRSLGFSSYKQFRRTFSPVTLPNTKKALALPRKFCQKHTSVWMEKCSSLSLFSIGGVRS